MATTFPTTYEIDSDKLWFRERWLRTTVTGDLAGAVHDPEHHHHHQHEDGKTRIHHDPPAYCTAAPVLMADHAPSTLTPDSDPRSNSNDFDIDEDNYQYDEYDDAFLEDDDLPSRAATPEPHLSFSMDDIQLHTRIQAHLTTLEDCLAASPDRDSFYANITPYLQCFYSNLNFLNRGAASVNLMRVARMPGADDLVDQARRVGEKLQFLRQQSGGFPDNWNVGVPLPVLGPGVLAEGRKVVSMFELFDEYVLPFFTLE